MTSFLDRWSLWQRATTRERALLAIGALVVLLALAWSLVWQPVTRDLVHAEGDLARGHAALALARQQAADIIAIVPSPAPGVVDVRATVERVLAQRALAGSVSVPDARDGRVRVVVATARFDALVAALGALAQESGIRAVEATLSARVEPGTVRAELTLAR